MGDLVFQCCVIIDTPNNLRESFLTINVIGHDMAKDNFTTVRISKDLHSRIKKLIAEGKLEGSHTVSGFVNHAVEERLYFIRSLNRAPSPEDDVEDDGGI